MRTSSRAFVGSRIEPGLRHGLHPRHGDSCCPRRGSRVHPTRSYRTTLGLPEQRKAGLSLHRNWTGGRSPRPMCHPCSLKNPCGITVRGPPGRTRNMLNHPRHRHDAIAERVSLQAKTRTSWQMPKRSQAIRALPPCASQKEERRTSMKMLVSFTSFRKRLDHRLSGYRTPIPLLKQRRLHGPRLRRL